MPNIDERLQALTQSVELMAQMQIQNEAKMAERMDELTDSVKGLALAMKAIALAHLDLAKSHIKHEDAISRLALIADSHDDRLDELEGDETE